MRHSPLLLLVTLSASAFSMSCEQRSAPERAVDKVENKVKDAADARPGEGVRDAVEDVKDSVRK